MESVSNYFFKNFNVSVEEFEASVNASTTIAVAGGSGSGKSTAISACLNSTMNRLLGNNIKSVQSSKIRNQIVPIKTLLEDTIMVLHFEKLKLDIFMENTINIIGEKITEAKGELEEEDLEDIFNESLFPSKTKAYNIEKIFNGMENREDLKMEMIRAIKKCSIMITDKEDSENFLQKIINEKKRLAKKKNEKFIIKEAYKKEIAIRSDKVDWKVLQSVFSRIALEIKNDILKSINILKVSGVSIQAINDNYYIIIEEEYIQEINKFMKEIYSISGKDTVISYISYYTPMTADLESVFNTKYDIKENSPIFSINDLKGLELGEDSITETIASISRILPDALIVFQRTTDIVSWYDAFLDTVKSQFPKLPIHGVFSFADMTLLNYIRGDFKSIDGPGTDIDEKSDYYTPAVLRAFNNLKSDVEPYIKKLENSNDNTECIICANIPDFVTRIDDVLESYGKQKLYDEKRLYKLFLNIYQNTKGKYKVIKTSSFDEAEEKVKIDINPIALENLAKECTIKHHKRYEIEYFKYRNFNVHWNTVYKWRAENRIGWGWKSNAKVYDNINIYIGPMCSSFISKEDLIDSISFNFETNKKEDDQERIIEYLRHNFLIDIDKIKKEIARELSYENMQSEFDTTYFSSALDLIYKKLSLESYWIESIKNILNKYIEIEMKKTFE